MGDQKHDQKHDGLARWHAVAAALDPAGIAALLADDAVFHSPVVHTPQRGKALAAMYLTGAMHVFQGTGFRYEREVVGPRDAVLEFTATLDGIHVNGVDMIHWNEDGLIDDFKVMIRPLKAVNMLHRMMAAMLEQLGPSAKASVAPSATASIAPSATASVAPSK